MKYLKLNTGHQIPMLGYGTWRSKPGIVYDAVRKAIELGYRHFDCAYMYQNESEIGKAFNDAFKAGEVKREDLFVTSKLWNNRHDPKIVQRAFESTLADLNIGYLDLYLIHWPVALKESVLIPESAADMVSLSDLPLAKTWEAMVKLTESDPLKSVGVSNFSEVKIKDITAKVGMKPAVNQVELHPYLQQSSLKSFCDTEEIVLTAYSPLGSYDRPTDRSANNEPNLFEDPILEKIAQEQNISVAQVMLAWAVNRGTTVIPKSTNDERMAQNLAAADIELTDNQMGRITSLDRHYRFVKGDFWCQEGSDYTYEELWNE